MKHLLHSIISTDSTEKYTYFFVITTWGTSIEKNSTQFYLINCSPVVKLKKVGIVQVISAHERALCQLTVCFKFQSRSDRRK